VGRVDRESEERPSGDGERPGDVPLDRKGFDGRVTFNDLDRAVDTLDEVGCKCICLLTGKGYSTLKATVQFDWKKVFRVPLQKPPA